MTIVGRLSAGCTGSTCRASRGRDDERRRLPPFVYVDFAFGLVSAVLLYLGLHT